MLLSLEYVVLLDPVTAISSIDEPARLQSSHQTVIDDAFNVDGRKARFSDLCEPLDVFHAFQRWVRLAVQAGQDFLISFFQSRRIGNT